MQLPQEIWTVGHSNLPWEEFLAVLRGHSIEAIADVRRYPGSRRYPHFSRESLSTALADQGIAYRHFPELGGRRKPQPDSRNTAWKNDSFRAYADYMETAAFAAALADLLAWAGGRRTAILCAEAVWWRCHRGLISDWLKARSVDVQHIFTAANAEPHPFTAAARLVDGELSYTAADEPTLFDAGSQS